MRFFGFRILAGVAQKHRVTQELRGLFNATHYFRIKSVGDIGHYHSNGVCLSGLQAAGDCVWLIVQCRHRFYHSLLAFWAYRNITVEDGGNGRCGHAGKSCNISHCELRSPGHSILLIARIDPQSTTDQNVPELASSFRTRALKSIARQMGAVPGYGKIVTFRLPNNKLGVDISSVSEKASVSRCYFGV